MKKGLSGFVGTLAVALAAAAVTTSPASAADIGHSFSTSFAGSGTNALSTGITSVDVDNSGGASQGDVYVTDATNHRVEKFDASGNFILMFGDEVNVGGGDVCKAAETCKAGNSGTSAQQLGTPTWIAVDGSGGASKGDVYVGDTGNNTIHKYDENGNLVTSWGAGGSLSGSPSGPFPNIAGIDVNPVSGQLAIWSSGAGQFFLFAESGTSVSSFSTCRGHSPSGAAIDPTGTRYFKVNGDQSVERFTPGSGQCIQITDYGQNTGTSGVNVDQVTGTLYRVEGSRVGEWKFNGSGQVVDATNTPCPFLESCPATHSFGQGEISNAQGIGVNSATNTLYVADAGNHRVAVFKAALAPLPVTEEPVGNTTVSGTVKPDGAGEVVECFFEYGKATGPTITYTNTKACSPGPNYTVDTPVTAVLEGLEGEQPYNYRLVAKNLAGAKNFGANKIITPHNVKGLKTEAATGITRTAAELHASFEGDGTHTTYYFEWGTGAEPPFANKSAVLDAASPSFPPTTPLALGVSGLKPQTVYRFRVAAENTTGFSPGKVLTFETLPAVPGLTTAAATNITQDEFTLNGEFLGNGEDTHYYFEYGPTSAYGQKFPVPEADAGSPTGPTVVSYVITEFLGYTTYHYRIVASNPVGETAGLDMTVTTLPAPLPVVAGSAVSDVGVTEATLHAEIIPNHWDTIYRVQYGLTASYGSKTLASESIGNGVTPHEISQTLSGLDPGTTYHARIQATNFTGTSYGPDLTFTTRDQPGAGPGGPPAGGGGTTPKTNPPSEEVKPPAPKCKKGFVRKHGKCVKRNKKKHHRKTGKSQR